MGWDYISELRPPVGLFFISHVIYEHGEPQWNDIGKGKPKDAERILSEWHFVSHKSHID
jgi:hypothetical protein